MTTELIPKAYITGEDLEKYNESVNLVLTCDYLPADESNVKLSTWNDAYVNGYYPPELNNCEVALINPEGEHEADGIKYSLVPILVHEAFEEEVP